MELISVLIAEDHTLTAHLLEQYLKSSKMIKVAGSVSNGYDVLDFLNEHPDTDIVLLDINMPKLDGIQTLAEMATRFPNVKAIMVTYLTEPYIIQKALKTGAHGYITKNAEAEEIINAILTVSKGGHYLSSESVQGVISNYDTKKKTSSSKITQLTEREKEILNLIASGKTNAEIAQKLFLSVRTIESHRRTILHKYGEKNFVSLIKFLLENKMIDVESENGIKDSISKN